MATTPHPSTSDLDEEVQKAVHRWFWPQPLRVLQQWSMERAMTIWMDERDAGFSTCSFAPVYGKGSALSGRDAGIGGDATRAGESRG